MFRFSERSGGKVKYVTLKQIDEVCILCILLKFIQTTTVYLTLNISMLQERRATR